MCVGRNSECSLLMIENNRETVAQVFLSNSSLSNLILIVLVKEMKLTNAVSMT